MDTQVFFSARGVPFDRLDSFPAGTAPPTKAIIRQLDFDERNDELWFYFSAWSDDVDLTTYGGLKKLIDDIVQPTYPFQHGPIYPNPAHPYGSPLSLKVPDLTYVIYKLSPRSWQFARRGYPVTVGTAGDSKYFCFSGNRVSATGYDYQDEGTPFNVPGPPRDGCNVLHFIVDGTTARENEDDDEYDHPINLHVDLIFNGGATIHRMPILIDPDVRYPGGAGP